MKRTLCSRSNRTLRFTSGLLVLAYGLPACLRVCAYRAFLPGLFLGRCIVTHVALVKFALPAHLEREIEQGKLEEDTAN